MKSTKYAICILLSAILCLESGCKKSEDETKPSMIGTVKTDFPYYVQIGSTVTAKASGITFPENVTWKWYASSMTTDTLVCNPVTVAVPDSVGEFGIMVGAYYDGYYASTTTALFQTIDTASALTFYGPKVSDKKFTDLRDGVTYDIIEVGGLQWFAQNLQWDGAGYPYLNSRILDRYFGRYYNWNEAITGCPQGWRLPDNNDWTSLASAVSGKSLTFEDENYWEGVGEKLTVDAWFLDVRMWEYWPHNLHTNTVGFNGLPMGFEYRKTERFQDYGTFACFWSATPISEYMAYYRYVYETTNDMPAAAASKEDIAMSVRCVRDIPK